MATSDELNAEKLLEEYVDKVDHKLHLILSATFPNLQRSGGAKATLKSPTTPPQGSNGREARQSAAPEMRRIACSWSAL